MPTTKMWATSAWWPALLLSLLVVAPAGAPAEEARNMRLVGTDLQARSAYQPIVPHQRIGTINALWRRAPHAWPPSRDITAHTQTPAAPGARCHSLIDIHDSIGNVTSTIQGHMSASADAISLDLARGDSWEPDVKSTDFANGLPGLVAGYGQLLRNGYLCEHRRSPILPCDA